jgi:pilus assembly protein CpaB
VFGLVALAASGAAAVLLTRYVDSQRVVTPVKQVVVAAVDIPLGEPIEERQLKTVAWPANALPAGAMLDPTPILGRVGVSKILAGELILEAKLAAKDAKGGLAALIPSAMRAVAVRVDDVVGVAGFIHPEDRVDVIVTLKPPKGDEPVSKVILQNVKVLTVGKDLEVHEARGRATAVTVATLLVDPEQAEKLALASTQGQILLTLRNWSDDDAISTAGMVPSVLIADRAPVVPKDAVKRREHPARATAGTTIPPVAPAEPKQVVEILRGDRYERRNFDKESQ